MSEFMQCDGNVWFWQGVLFVIGSALLGLFLSWCWAQFKKGQRG